MQSIPPLDSTAHDLILSCLSEGDLISFSKVNKVIREMTSSYRIRAFYFPRLLSPYFSENELDGFRRVQARTGALISGSTALQFFGRLNYENSDLDVYVEHDHCLRVGHFLLQVGFSFEPRPSQNASFDAAKQYIDTNPVTPALNAALYIGRGVAGVFNFTRGGRKIQLITSKRNPFDIILRYHSTCVMNVITHDTAYCLYPHATFVENRSLICSTEGASQDAAISKYESRGWEMVKHVASSEQHAHRSDFYSRSRWVGDRQCWKIRLPDLDLVVPLPSYVIGNNSWELSYSTSEAHMFYTMPGTTTKASRLLKYKYVMTHYGDLYQWVRDSPGLDQNRERCHDEELCQYLKATRYPKFEKGL